MNSVPSIVIILLIALPLFYYKLGSLALVGPDEPRYAQVAREMFERSDPITPTLAGDVWFEKPVLPYWMMIGFYHLIGVNEWAARLPSALLATLNLFIIYFIGSRAAGRRYGVWSAIALASSGLYFGFARAASFDMPLTFTFAAALGSFYLADAAEEERTRRRYLYCFYAAVGLSTLAKGLVGPVLIGGIVALYAIITGQWRNLLRFYPFSGLLIFLLIASSWYSPAILRHGRPFIDEFFIQHHFERFATNRYHHPGPIYYFLAISIAGTAPWSMLLVAWAVKSMKQFFSNARMELRFSASGDLNAKQRLHLLIAIWITVPLVFFSLSTSKLPGYILPIFPALALAIGIEIESLFAVGVRGRKAIPATAALLAAIGIALPFFARKEFQIDLGAQLVLAAIPIGTAAALTFAFLRQNAWLAAAVNLIFSSAIAVAIASLLFAGIENKSSIAPLARAAAAEMRPAEKLIFFNYLQYSPFFYINGRIVLGADGEAKLLYNADELAETLMPYQSLLCITRSRLLDEIKNDPRFDSVALATQRDIVLLRVSLRR